MYGTFTAQSTRDVPSPDCIAGTKSNAPPPVRIASGTVPGPGHRSGAGLAAGSMQTSGAGASDGNWIPVNDVLELGGLMSAGQPAICSTPVWLPQVTAMAAIGSVGRSHVLRVAPP